MNIKIISTFQNKKIFLEQYKMINSNFPFILHAITTILCLSLLVNIIDCNSQLSFSSDFESSKRSDNTEFDQYDSQIIGNLCFIYDMILNMILIILFFYRGQENPRMGKKNTRMGQENTRMGQKNTRMGQKNTRMGQAFKCI